MNEHNILITGAIAGLGWLAWSYYNSTPATAAYAAVPQSNDVPWYLNYNVTAPVINPPISTLASMATGIENQTSSPCNGCSNLFGTSFGSSY